MASPPNEPHVAVDEASPPATSPPTGSKPAPSGLNRLGPLQWGLLLGLTAVIAYLFHAWQVTSALFLGPLLAGLIFAFSGSSLKVSRKVTIVSQAVIGCSVARAIDMTILSFVATHWLAIAGVIIATAAAACVVAYGLVRYTTLTPQTAAWGSMPGAANIMVTLAAASDGDPRLVAFMQYVRLITVLSTASLVASLLIGTGVHVAHGAAAPRPPQPADVDILTAAPAIVIGLIGLTIGRLARIPAGPLLVTAALGAIVNLNGWFPIALPHWMMVLSYGAVGWYVGLQFDRAVLAAAMRNLPAMILAMLVLILLCGVTGMILSIALHVDFVTGYLATSPGAIDSIAILALGGEADMSVVMAVQTLRFFAVIMMAPYLVRLICRFLPSTVPA
ncbi:AbrB family transcriptional regulator [Phenylobacterium sp.]|uniref:AbrB family transcriptional regulator n=1 Tax=Phenylobacterium sp. TaxID=1871053 RepID=UPI00301B6EF9